MSVYVCARVRSPLRESCSAVSDLKKEDFESNAGNASKMRFGSYLTMVDVSYSKHIYNHPYHLDQVSYMSNHDVPFPNHNDYS